MSNNERYASLWFKQAKFDLDAAKSSKENKNYEWTCFQCQQSAEKALKAFLFFNRKRNIITHSIRRLVEQCGTFDKDFLDIRKVKTLDQYYIPTRYPNGLPDEIPHEFYTEDDAELCVEYAQMVIQLVQAKLKNL
jgi:HEPN domain-containing protein